MKNFVLSECEYKEDQIISARLLLHKLGQVLIYKSYRKSLQSMLHPTRITKSN